MTYRERPDPTARGVFLIAQRLSDKTSHLLLSEPGCPPIHVHAVRSPSGTRAQALPIVILGLVGLWLFMDPCASFPNGLIVCYSVLSRSEPSSSGMPASRAVSISGLAAQTVLRDKWDDALLAVDQAGNHK